MHEIRAETIAGRQELKQTLWHCPQCTALIAIYSTENFEMAICPICCDVTLDQRGSFESILGITFQGRSPADS
jgi:Zn-finger nucleic acid-binding protein